MAIDRFMIIIIDYNRNFLQNSKTDQTASFAFMKSNCISFGIFPIIPNSNAVRSM